MEPAVLRSQRRGLVRRLPLLHEYVQLQFFRGTSLDPVPPKASSHAEVRCLDVYEDDNRDEDRLAAWIEQASKLSGETMSPPPLS